MKNYEKWKEAEIERIRKMDVVDVVREITQNEMSICEYCTGKNCEKLGSCSEGILEYLESEAE